MKATKLVANIATLFFSSIWCFGQTSPNLENGFKHWGSFDINKIDTVGTLNGNQMLHASLMPDRPQRGGLTLSDILYNTREQEEIQTLAGANGTFQVLLDRGVANAG